MKCSVIPCGRLYANCCILSDGEGNAIVLDPGGDLPVLEEWLRREGLTVRLILLTHGHEDHTGALAALKEHTGAPVCVHREDAYRLPVEADRLLEDGEEVSVGEMKLKVLHTPGHTEGSVCYYAPGEFLFSGDTLFRESVGRTDFPGGSTPQLMASLEKLLTIEDPEAVVIPGHGQYTTLDYEREFNPFLR